MSSMGTPTGRPGDLGLAAGFRLAIDQRNVGGSAAHIEGDDALEAAESRRGRGADDTACRPGKHGTHRLAGSVGQGSDSAARLHDEDAVLARRGLLQTLLQAFEVVLHHRLQVGVHHDGAGALVLAEFRKNLCETESGRFESCQRSFDGLLVVGFAKEKSKQIATASGCWHRLVWRSVSSSAWLSESRISSFAVDSSRQHRSADRREPAARHDRRRSRTASVVLAGRSRWRLRSLRW